MKTSDDIYSAIWLSYSALSDILACPKSYYYSYVYKNPKTGRKIGLVNPFMSLGQSFHAVMDILSLLPADERFAKPLKDRFETTWENVSGKKGGFTSEKQEAEFKERGLGMLQRLEANPGILLNKALKLKQDLPYFWLSEKENMILCGKIDWIEYLSESDSIHIVDFKTGQRTEKEDSLQLPIYYLLAKNCQTREISKLSYWYVTKDDEPSEIPIPDYDESYDRIMKVASRIKLARQLNHFNCSIDPQNGCKNCAPYEAIVAGKAEFVGVGEYKKEMYFLPEEAMTL